MSTNQRHPALLLGAWVLIAAALCPSCGSNQDLPEPSRRAVLIGIDSADWRILEALADAGHMPNLMGLRERGVSGPLETLNDIALSPVIWTSIATGHTAAQHGITWFMVDQPDGTRVPVRSTNRKTEALWNILAANQQSCSVIGWWATYPAEDLGQGVMVSDALGFHGFGSTARDGDDLQKTHPSAMFAELDSLVPPEQQISFDFLKRFVHIDERTYREEMFDPARYPRRDPFNPIHLFQQYAVTAQGYTSIAEKLLQERNDALCMVYFEQVDSFSHLFMKYAPPRLEWVDVDEFERYRDVVYEWYKYQDELLGRLLAKIDLETTAVFIVSDHGFKSDERRIRSEQTVDVKKAHLDHETDGIFLAAGPHIPRGGKLNGASVLDVTPTLLHYLGLPIGKDMAGKVLTDSLDAEFMQQHPIRYVSTHEPAAARRRPTESIAMGAGEQAAIEQGLSALGYMDEGEDSHGQAAEAAAEVSSPEIHNGMGRILLRNGEPDKALLEFQKALALNANDPDALLNISSIHQIQGKGDLAQHFVERALAVDPNSVGALAQLAELKRDQGHIDEAIRLFYEALAIDNSHPFLHQGLGDVLQRAGRYDAALKAFQSVLELEPDSFKARYNLSVTYANMGNAEKAIAISEEALRLAPKDPEAPAARNNLGALLLARGETERALENFEAALKAAPYSLESRYNAALIYLGQDKLTEAILRLEEASKLQPTHELVHLRLGMTYLSVGRGDEAYRTLLLVRRLYPRNWAAIVALAALHAGAQQADQAMQLLSEALAAGGAEARVLAADFPVLLPLLSE